MSTSLLEALAMLGMALLLAWPLGRYLAAVMRADPLPGDRFFALIEQPIYRMLGTQAQQGMSWRGYAWAFGVSNLVLTVPVCLMFMMQAHLPLNPNAAPNMSWDLALHTMLSFLTNTNQQHYAGQAQLSHFSQMTAVITLQVMTPMMGLAIVTATLRGLFGGRQVSRWQEGATVDVGNYWADVLRPTVRCFMPLALLMSLGLSAQGVPATFEGGPTVPLRDALASSAPQAVQKIPLGPVAPMVAVKQLGTNGGGWYGPNSATPLENPTPLSNALQTLSLVLLPMAVACMVGPLTGRRSVSALVVGTMLCLSVLSLVATLVVEGAASTPHHLALMEGKELRLGAGPSAAWAALTTQTSNGSVNAMHDSMAPLSGLILMINMLINSIWGGVGCGLQQMLVYVLITVFLAGLMTGKTPELWGRKIETPEVQKLAILVLLQPVVVLSLTAVTLAFPSLTGHSPPSAHALSQVFYEYVSAFANNGSGLEGLSDNTPWWNVSCAVVMALGRYPALILPLAVAAGMAAKRQAPESEGSLSVETPTFALTLMAVMVVLTLLQFMPVLVLGPVAEHLSPVFSISSITLTP